MGHVQKSESEKKTEGKIVFSFGLIRLSLFFF